MIIRTIILLNTIAVTIFEKTTNNDFCMIIFIFIFFYQSKVLELDNGVYKSKFEMTLLTNNK